jgi:hypothetical protein
MAQTSVILRMLWRQLNFQFWRVKLAIFSLLSFIFIALILWGDGIEHMDFTYDINKTAYMDRPCDNKLRELCSQNGTEYCAGANFFQ